jgi:AraC family transcriptional regulator of adaptative response/methylated-DNA-[protein]-cysteine methyltransferase
MASIFRGAIDTPIGQMAAFATPEGLCGLEFVEPKRLDRFEARLARWFSPYETIDDPSFTVIEATESWLAEYFEGSCADSRLVPLDLRGTLFELRVWKKLLDVLPGSTRTYGEIARELRKPNAARAVGLAVGSNPVSIIVPCHRIVGTSGSLTGYGGGLHRKEWLLRHESRWSRDGAGRLF